MLELWGDDDFRAVVKSIGVDVEVAFAGQVIHRLDTPVSGVLLLGKTPRALEAGSALFADRGVQKVYWALVANPLPKPEGRLRHWLEHRQQGNKTFAHRDAAPGRQDSWLDYKLLAQGDRYTLYEIILGTGRTHQIRAQFAAAGSPVKGDLKYGAPRSNQGGGISLLARSLTFEHPFTQRLVHVQAQPPEGDKLWSALVALAANSSGT
ncbi:MAG: RluA family pseudouridine synthase [Spirochaetales bacterium]